MDRKKVVGAVSVLLVCGCSTFSSGDTRADYARRQMFGSITVSDAKVHRRESLINERRREIRYIDQQLTKSEQENFIIGPDVVREFEIIRALAISAGVAADQGIRQANSRSQDISDIRHEMDVIQLNMQLSQLRRDASLFNDQLVQQTAVSDGTLSQLNTTPAAGSLQNPAVTGVEALIDRIDALQGSLQSRLGASAPHLSAVGIGGNPIDQFRDRAAYRQVLTTARNAATLDELHDMDGSALYRLSFQVTTLPPPASHKRAMGVVEVTPSPAASALDDREIHDIYAKWTDYIYRTAGATPESGHQFAIYSGLMAANVVDAIKLVSGTRKADGKIAIPCDDLTSVYDKTDGCSSRWIMVPNITDSLKSLGVRRKTIGEIVALDRKTLEANYDSFVKDQAKISNASMRRVVYSECKLLPRDPSQVSVDVQAGDAIIDAAVSLSLAVPHVLDALQVTTSSNTFSGAEIAVVSAERMRLMELHAKATRIVDLIGGGACPGTSLMSKVQLAVPLRFKETIVASAQRGIRVYEVGPREQVQQVSTAARAAEALNLALALAGNAQSAGVSANAGLGYSRSAVGRSDLIERLPTIVGFSQSSEFLRGKESSSGEKSEGEKGEKGEKAYQQSKFGWVLGPRINSIDAKRGSIELEQVQRTYDLSADLAVSGWRTQLPLEIRTAWAPNWNSHQTVSVLDNKRATMQTTIVHLRPSDGELSALTRQLTSAALSGGRRDYTMRVINGRINACHAATILLEGDNLWRTTDVLIGTVRINGDAVAVLPDMRGISIDIPAKTAFNAAAVDVQALTPFGIIRSQAGEGVVIDGFDPKGCDKPAAPATDLRVSAIKPLNINTCEAVDFTIEGANLEKITDVRLGNLKGTLSQVKAGATERDISFTASAVAKIVTATELLQPIAGKEKLAPYTIGAIRLCRGAP